MKKNIRLICVIGILVTGLMACNVPGDLFSSTSGPTLAAPGPGIFDDQATSDPDQLEDALLEKIVFSDSFSDKSGGWKTENFVEGSTAYLDEGFLITLNRSEYLLWSTAGMDYGNVRLDVDASWVGGGADNTFGLICRYQDAQNFYALVISSDGFYSIRKRTPTTGLNVISAGGYLYSDEILQSSQENHLRAECNRDRLRLFANGTLLAEIVDKDFVQGDVGLIAGTFSAETTQIRFDNFVAEPLD